MKTLFIQGLLAISLLGALASATAEEAILNFHSNIVIQADGSLDVTETIEVRAEGDRIRRGIYRDFPTRYRTRAGDRVVVEFEPLEVRRDGEPEPWFTEDRANGVRINTGDDSFLPVPLETTYTLRYHTSRQLGFFDNHDELYWNVTGTGWIFPIEQASARVQLPAAVPEEDLQLDFYTGRQGSRLQNARAWVPELGVVEFATTEPLRAGEGLTIVVGFPKGLVAEPAGLERLGWFLRDNRGPLVLLVGLIGIFLYFLRQWRRHGRDPAPGPIFPRYYPPEDFSPGGLRYLLKGGYDDRSFAADLVQMAVKGLLSISQEKATFGNKWTLAKLQQATSDTQTPSEQALFSHLFKEDEQVELDKKNHGVLGKAKSEHQKALARRFKPRYLVDNLRPTLIGIFASIALIVVAFIAATHLQSITLWILVAILVVMNVVFGFLMRRPTQEGRRLLDHIEGLKLYMRVASKDDIARLKLPEGDEPPMDAERFESLLPYALALDVEDAWTDKFIQAVGVTAATAAMGGWYWYHGYRQGAGLSDFTSDLGNSLSSQIAASSSPPGSTSGAGGGGFSGGGGGGGGGGGR